MKVEGKGVFYWYTWIHYPTTTTLYPAGVLKNNLNWVPTQEQFEQHKKCLAITEINVKDYAKLNKQDKHDAVRYYFSRETEEFLD